jgi:hypothetical protein
VNSGRAGGVAVGWATTFTDPPAVIVDRLTSGGNITGTGTGRLTHTPASSPQS